MDKEFLATEKDIDELKINKADKADLSILENSIDNLKTEKLDKSDVDSALSSTSENPVQNKVIYEAIQNAGSKITVDSALLSTSENPVQNKVVTQAINTSNQNINILKSRVQAVEDGLDPDISADFLTSEGFGNLRYYNGHFQKYDRESSTWIDTAATPENVYVLNMQPQSMKMIRGAFDYKLGLNKLKFLEPDDTILDNQFVCVIDKVIIRRKLNSYPTDENDGEFVVEIKRSDFGLYYTNWFYDNSCTPNIDEIWCYKAFPVSTTGFINNSSLNETKIKYVDINKVPIYGFEINQAESDPASMITYLEDCANAYFDPAYMDYEKGTFNYGSWDNAWFIRDIKPVVLNYDGSVKYELDPNDYTKKKDGTNSNIDSDNLNGYVMIGIPKVYYKCEIVSKDVVRYYFCSEQLDDSYVCWSHINAIGNEIDYCYISAYNVNYDGTNIKCRSGLDRSSGIQYSQIISTMDSSLNSGAHIWDGFVFSDYCLLTLLLMLIGKSTDTQATFGKGAGGTHHQNGSENKKGIFYGDDTNTNLKTFGIEHLWGDGDIVTAGSITKNGTFHSKMVYGTQDGSLGNGYDADGEGYIINTDFTAPNASGSYIDKFYFTDKGIFPKSVVGSSTTYFCDGYYGATEKGMFMFGFNYMNQATCGMFSNAYHITNGSNSYTMFKLSCKPL